MSNMKIDKDVPLPKRYRIEPKYPIADMEVGDSVKIPIWERGKIYSSAAAYGQKQDPAWEFTTRKVSETTSRLWRIK